MELKGVVVDGREFEAEELSSKHFLNVIKARLGERNSDPEIVQGLKLLGGYEAGKIIGKNEQLTIAKTITSANAQAIVDGEIFFQNRTSEEVGVLKSFAITIEDFMRRTQEILDKGDIPKLLHKLEGISLGIFSVVEDGKLMFFIDDIDNPDEGEYGFIVNQDGESFETLNDDDFAYLIYSEGADTYILEGSISKGFKKVGEVKGLIPDGVAILKKGFTSYIKDGLFTIKDIYDGEEVFECSEGDIEMLMPSGNPVDIVSYKEITRFIFISEDDNGNFIFNVRDENGVDVFWSRSFPHIILTENGVYILLYSSEGGKYVLSNEDNGILLESIFAIIDDNGQYYFGGNLPEKLLRNDGTFTIRFVCKVQNINGQQEYQESYVISGIVGDIVKPREATNLITAISPSTSVH